MLARGRIPLLETTGYSHVRLRRAHWLQRNLSDLPPPTADRRPRCIGNGGDAYLQVRSFWPGGGLPHAILRLRQNRQASVSGFFGVSSTSVWFRDGAGAVARRCGCSVDTSGELIWRIEALCDDGQGLVDGMGLGRLPSMTI